MQATVDEIDAAFASLVRERQDALFVSPDLLFAGRRVQLILLAARHAIPATFAIRDIAEAGGLDELRNQHCGCVSTNGRLCRPYPQRAPSPRTYRSSSRPGFELIINLNICQVDRQRVADLYPAFAPTT